EPHLQVGAVLRRDNVRSVVDAPPRKVTPRRRGEIRHREDVQKRRAERVGELGQDAVRHRRTREVEGTGRADVADGAGLVDGRGRLAEVSRALERRRDYSSARARVNLLALQL